MLHLFVTPTQMTQRWFFDKKLDYECVQWANTLRLDWNLKLKTSLFWVGVFAIVYWRGKSSFGFSIAALSSHIDSEKLSLSCLDPSKINIRNFFGTLLMMTMMGNRHKALRPESIDSIWICIVYLNCVTLFRVNYNWYLLTLYYAPIFAKVRVSVRV